MDTRIMAFRVNPRATGDMAERVIVRGPAHQVGKGAVAARDALNAALAQRGERGTRRWRASADMTVKGGQFEIAIIARRVGPAPERPRYTDPNSPELRRERHLNSIAKVMETKPARTPATETPPNSPRNPHEWPHHTQREEQEKAARQAAKQAKQAQKLAKQRARAQAQQQAAQPTGRRMRTRTQK